MDTTQDWTATRISYLKALKTPSDAQRVLVQLYELPQRSSKQDRELATLLKLEKINETLEVIRGLVSDIEEDIHPRPATAKSLKARSDRDD